MAHADQITHVFAEHGHGLDRYSGARVPTTFLYADEAKKTRLGWIKGHLADGAHYRPDFGRTQIIHLIGVKARKAA